MAGLKEKWNAIEGETAKHICDNCGTRNYGFKKNVGSLGLELLLWVLMAFLIPYTFGFSLIVSLIYTGYRFFNKTLHCSSCEKETMIGVDTPKGKKLLAEYSN